ncbi:hypothetical protein [Alcanivorax sp.]|uniref:hypothetical protein n=1 Tax=Alcanivorax sp. TaxID=1872427 RepID=UPI000C10BB0C|nr:hypothetical protein [Alcanivorax sp.]PHR67259.1 MAG: hypothetical protein COA55_07695 [Alcanivorax sp.]
MEKIKPERLDWDDLKASNKNTGQGSAAGTIAAAIIFSSVITIGGWIGYQEYKEWEAEQAAIKMIQQFNQETKAITERANRERARIRAEREKRNAAIEQRNRETRETREMNRRECRYWRGQYSKLKTPEIRAMVRKHCL